MTAQWPGSPGVPRLMRQNSPLRSAARISAKRLLRGRIQTATGADGTEHPRITARTTFGIVTWPLVNKLAPRQLDNFYRDMLGRGSVAFSVRRFHSVLHAALDRAVRWGLLGTNPTDRATPYRRGSARAPRPVVTLRVYALPLRHVTATSPASWAASARGVEPPNGYGQPGHCGGC